MKRLTTIIEDAGPPDVLGIQEVEKVESVRDLASRLSHGGRRFSYVLTKCSGKSKMHVGFLYDEERVKLLSTREYPELDPRGGEECGIERSGLAAKLERQDTSSKTELGAAFQLLVLHMIAGGEPSKQTRRREQWRRAHTIAKDLAKEGPVAILGDTNSTGFLDDKHGERTFILDEAKRAGLEVPTSDLKCTEYFKKSSSSSSSSSFEEEDEGESSSNNDDDDETPLTPSTLDHFVTSPGFGRPRSVEVHGYCAALACKPTTSVPVDYRTVSDHCPVTLDLF